MEINKLLQISKDLKLADVHKELLALQTKLTLKNKSLIIPLVGEFSAGKTSLINTLTDNKKLETASKATTATIFEIRFGAKEQYAEVIDSTGNMQKENIEDVKNANLTDIPLVRIYDTSTNINDTTVLVDTPGLSSNDPRHRLALTSYLPNADAILLTTDVNQQITRSLIEFIETSKLVERPIYLVITKCDTKTPNEIEEVKQYISENIKLPLDNIVCISAKENNMTELYSLLDQIQRNKNTIVTKAIEHRVIGIAQNLLEYVNDLIEHSKIDSDIDKEIDRQQIGLRKISNNIESLLHDTTKQMESKKEEYIYAFSSHVFSKLT